MEPDSAEVVRVVVEQVKDGPGALVWIGFAILFACGGPSMTEVARALTGIADNLGRIADRMKP